MTRPHGVRCVCDACWTLDGLHDDDMFGKAIARAAEHEFVSDCD